MPLNGPEHLDNGSPELYLDGSDHNNGTKSDFSLPWLIPKVPSSMPAIPGPSPPKKARKACLLFVAACYLALMVSQLMKI